MAGLGLTLPNLLKLQAAEQTLAMPAVESYKPIATSIIHIYLPGGMEIGRASCRERVSSPV